MSFIDGIVTTAKSVLGIESAPEKAPKAAAKSNKPTRSEHLASDTPTAFDRESSPTTNTSRSSGPTLAERLRRIQASADTSRDSVPPHLGGTRSNTSPPTSTARVLDASTGQASSSDTAMVAASHVQQGLDYFARTFGRNGIDGAGSGVEVLINDRSTNEYGEERFAGNGGYYATPQADGSVTEAIHFGTGTSYDFEGGLVEQYEMLHADDLSIHELTHGIIRKETGYLGGDANESGATNEGIADVMAAAATRDWSIGEGMYSEQSDYRRMRNIADPNDPTAIHGLWTSIDEVRTRQRAKQEVEEHWASGVISTAAQRVQDRFGGESGWQVVERVFYESIDHNRLGDMSFTAVAAGLRAAAAAVYGTDSSVVRVFDEELRRAGL